VTPWNTIVPDPEPNDPARNPWAGTYGCTFYGGDLQGVQQDLDYLQSWASHDLLQPDLRLALQPQATTAALHGRSMTTWLVAGDFDASNALFQRFAAEVAGTAACT
jgi:hypothetical protein